MIFRGWLLRKRIGSGGNRGSTRPESGSTLHPGQHVQMQPRLPENSCKRSLNHLASLIPECGTDLRIHSGSRSKFPPVAYPGTRAAHKTLRQHAFILNEAARSFFAHALWFSGLGHFAVILKKEHSAPTFCGRHVGAAVRQHTAETARWHLGGHADIPAGTLAIEAARKVEQTTKEHASTHLSLEAARSTCYSTLEPGNNAKLNRTKPEPNPGTQGQYYTWSNEARAQSLIWEPGPVINLVQRSQSQTRELQAQY